MPDSLTAAVDPATDRLLVVFPSWVGDTVMATPFLRALRTIPAISKAHLAGYMRPGLDEVVTGLPELDEVIVGRPGGSLGPLFQGTELARRRFDAAVLLPNSFRLALTLMLSSIPRRIGYRRDLRGLLLTDPVSCPTPGGWKEPISAVDYYLYLARQFGDAPLDDRVTRLYASAEQQAAGERILERAGIDNGRPIALLNPGSNRPDKRWPPDRFAMVANHLASGHGMRVLVNGSPFEHELVHKIVTMAKCDAVDLPGLGVSLGSLKWICARSRFVVTNDTGTRHLAVGIANGLRDSGVESDLALVSLFGPTRPEWSKIDYPNETELSTDGGPIDGISLESVLDACDRLLA